MKEKVRRVVALIGIFVLVGMYVFTVIAAIMDNPATMKILAVSIALTIIIPIILYVLSIFIRGGREDVLSLRLRTVIHNTSLRYQVLPLSFREVRNGPS